MNTKKTPFPHQLSGFEYGVNRGSGYIYSDPRTGKTFIMQLIEDHFKCDSVLIIAPATVLATWEGALLEEGEDPNSIEVLDIRHKITVKEMRPLLLNPMRKWFLVNFEKLDTLDSLTIRENIPAAIGIRNWDMVILDESYRIANPEATVTKYVVEAPKPDNQKRFVLSGYPKCESVVDIAPQALFTDGKYFGCDTMDEYLDRFWYWCDRTYKYRPKNKLHLEAVQQWIKDNTWGVRLEDLGLGGEKLFSKAMIPISETQVKWMEWLATAEMYHTLNEEGEYEIKEIIPPTRHLFEQKIASGINPLTNEMIDDSKIRFLVDSYKEHAEPMLIVSRFKSPLKWIKEAFEKERIQIEIIDGDVPLEKREEIRRDFQEGRLNIVGGQVKTIKMGLDFSRLKWLYYPNNGGSFDDRAQSQLRGQHVKRTTPYNIVDICTTHTNDAEIVDILIHKGHDANKYTPKLNKETLSRWVEDR